MLGTLLAEDANGDDPVLDSAGDVYNESVLAFAVLAKLAEFPNMEAILDIFA
jgi:hypothetical protein